MLQRLFLQVKIDSNSISFERQNVIMDMRILNKHSFVYSSQQDKTRHWLIKLVPSDQDLREIVLKHDLFKKELRFYQEVIPALTAFVASSKSSKKQ